MSVLGNGYAFFLPSSRVELAVIDAAPQRAVLFLHEHNIRGPRTLGRLNHVLLKHVGNMLLNSVQVRGWVSA